MTSVPLSALLNASAQVITRVLAGESLSRALPAIQARIPASHHGGTQDLSYHALRYHAQTELLLQQWMHTKPDPYLTSLLQCALALLMGQRYPAHTLVHQCVEAVAQEHHWAKKLVNAILRRYLREEKDLAEQFSRRPNVAANLPAWWLNQLQRHYPEDSPAIVAAQKLKPPLTLRVNRRRCSVEDYQNILTAAGIEARRLGTAFDLPALTLSQPIPINQIPHFSEGWVSVQDLGAQMAITQMDLAPGMKVLDACAAPGGKSAHILEHADVQLTALDHDSERLYKVESTLHRLGLHDRASLTCTDARRFRSGQKFDRILADLPCTASGIVRRHPDIPWLRRPEDTSQLAQTSAQILDHLWTLLEPDGILVMATCSIWPAESKLQAESFIARHNIQRHHSFGQLLPGVPHPDLADCDGLFYAQFWKN